ncbi:hypothetical protein BGZ73_003227 [Actinomortierella ambigua]|nr:hypothetical protein BGZ73_003227 [Actinomortierella ambigua]
MAMFDKLPTCLMAAAPFPSIQCSPYPSQDTQQQLSSSSLSPQPTQSAAYNTPPAVPSMEFTYNHLPLHHQQHHAAFQPSSEYIKPREATNDSIQSMGTQQTSATASLVEEGILPNTTQSLGPFLGSSPMPASSPSSLYDEQQLLQQQMRREHILLSQQHTQQHLSENGEPAHGFHEPLSSSASPSPHSSSSSPNTVSIASITPLASPTLSACFSSFPTQTMIPDLISQSAPLPIQTLAPAQPVVTSMETTVAPGTCASPSNTLTVGSMQSNQSVAFDSSLNPDVPVAWMNSMLAPSKMARFEHQQHQTSPSRHSNAYRVAHGNHFLTAPGRIAPTRSMSLSCYAGDILSEQMLSQQQIHPHHPHYHQQHQQQLQRRSMSISVYPTTTFTHSPSTNVSALHGPGLSASPAPTTGTPFSSMASSPALSPMSMAGSPAPPMGPEWELMQQQQQQHDQSMTGFHNLGSLTSPSAGMHQLSLSPKHITPHPFASYTFPPVQDQQASSPMQHQSKPSTAASVGGIASKVGSTRSRKSSRSTVAGPTKPHHQRQPTPLALTARLPSPLSSQPSSPITSVTGLASASASRHRKSSLSISSSSSLSSACSSSSSPSLSSGTTHSHGGKSTSAPSTPSSSMSSAATSATSVALPPTAPEVHACVECDITFAGPAVLLRHQESIHKKIAWCCMGCGSRLCRRDAVTRHMNLSPTGSVCRQVGEIGQLNKIGEEYVVVERNPYIAKPLRVVLTKMGKRLPPGLLDEEEENAGVHQGDTTAIASSAVGPAVVVSSEVGPLAEGSVGAMPQSMMMASGSDDEVNHHHHYHNNTNYATIPLHSRKRSSPGDEQPLYNMTDATSPYTFPILKPDRKQRKHKNNSAL